MVPIYCPRGHAGQTADVKDQVTELVLQLEREAPKDGVTRMMHELLRYLNETLNIAVDTYADPSFFDRNKRGLINGLRQLSCMLFGTAMDEDVEDLRDRYNHFASLAANQNKAVNMNSLHINRLEEAVQDIASYSRTVRTALNAMIADVKGIYEMVLINQALPALESAINSVLHTNNLVIQNVVDADRGWETSSLFHVKDFAESFNERRKGTPTNPFVCCACHTPLLSLIGVVLDIRCYSH